jgi:hypothetical protein
MGTFQHGGQALAALAPATQQMFPEAAAPTLGRSLAWLEVALFVIDAGARAEDVRREHGDAVSNQEDAKELAKTIKERIDALNAKLHDVQNLQQLIARQPSCA